MVDNSEATEILEQAKGKGLKFELVEASEEDLLGIYNEYLDSAETVFVCGMRFMPSDILRELDPTAYRCGFNDWMDSEIRGGNELFDWEGETYSTLDNLETLEDLQEQLEELEEINQAE